MSSNLRGEAPQKYRKHTTGSYRYIPYHARKSRKSHGHSLLGRYIFFPLPFQLPAQLGPNGFQNTLEVCISYKREPDLQGCTADEHRGAQNHNTLRHLLTCLSSGRFQGWVEWEGAISFPPPRPPLFLSVTVQCPQQPKSGWDESGLNHCYQQLWVHTSHDHKSEVQLTTAPSSASSVTPDMGGLWKEFASLPGQIYTCCTLVINGFFKQK